MLGPLKLHKRWGTRFALRRRRPAQQPSSATREGVSMNAVQLAEKAATRESAYPRYATYQSLKRNPSVVTQEFESFFEVQPGKLLYPRNERLEKHFGSDEASLRFGAAQFCGFLHDTIAVEHQIVIPAVLALGQAQFRIPMDAVQELYKIVTDEGHHAAQALS